MSPSSEFTFGNRRQSKTKESTTVISTNSTAFFGGSGNNVAIESMDDRHQEQRRGKSTEIWLSMYRFA